MNDFPERHAISRASFFLDLAEKCSPEDRKDFEAFLEASIIFARTAIHRLKHHCSNHPEWGKWFEQQNNDSAVCFFRHQRNFILKEGPPKVGQTIGFNSINRASELYYFESPYVDAVSTVRRHLVSLSITVFHAESRFSQ